MKYALWMLFWILVTIPVVAGALFLQGSFTTGVIIAEAGVASATPLARQAIYVVETKNDDTGVAIANPNATTANITLQLVDTNGVVAFPDVITTLPANNHTAKFVSPLFPGAASSFYGTLRMISATLSLTSLLNPTIEWLEQRAWPGPLASPAKLFSGLHFSIG